MNTGHGADLEHALVVERPRAGARITIGDHPTSTGRIQEPDDDAHDPMRGRDLHEQGAHLGVRRKRRLRGRLRDHQQERTEGRNDAARPADKAIRFVCLDSG